MSKAARKKRASERQEVADLIGIDAIFDFLNRDLAFATLLELTFNWDFPMEKRGPEPIWVGCSSNIKRWFEERDITPQTLTKESLLRYEHAQRRKAGTVERFNRICRAFEDFKKTFGLSENNVFTFHRDCVGCPIKKDPAGGYCVDVDEMWEWMEQEGLALGPGIRTGREAGKGLWYVNR